MADYSELKAAIRAAIYDNVSQAITGDKLQEILLEMVDELGQSYVKPAGGIPASDIASGVIPDVSQFITKTVNDLVNYYKKTETYTQQEVNNLIGAISQFHYEIYASLEAITDPASNVLYLIGPSGSGADRYEEYVYASDVFTKIGDTSIDLSEYLKYTAQTLTDVQKQQARTNIGATAPEIFWATYGTTTASEIETALAAGKLPVVADGVYRYPYVGSNSTYMFFGGIYATNVRSIRLTIADNTWYLLANNGIQYVSNLVTSFGSTPSDSKYPSEKLVKNSLDAKQNVISSSNKLDYSLIDNVPQDATPVSQSDQQFTFRQTAGGAKPGASLAKVTEVRGNTLVWNQLIQNGNFSDGTTGWSKSGDDVTISATDGVLSWVRGNGEGSIANNLAHSMNIVGLHKYYVRFEIKGSEENQLTGAIGATALHATFSDINYGTSWMNISLIVSPNDTPVSNSSIFFRPNYLNKKNFTAYFRNIIVIDLTQMGIADIINTPADFEKWYDANYYAFNAGTLLNNKTATLETVGFNQLEEVFDEGSINSEGQEVISANSLRSKNYCDALPETQYYFKYPAGTTNTGYLCWYDANKNFIGRSSATRGGGVLTSPANCRYFRMSIGGYGAYTNDFCVNFSDTSKNGTYQPYEKHTLTLNLPTLTGKLNGEGSSVTIAADGLKSAGSAYDEFVVENGYITKFVKRVGSVDLGDGEWTQLSGKTVFRRSLGTAKAPSSNYTPANIVCANYVTTGSGDVESSQSGIGLSVSKMITIGDSRYSDATAFGTAMSGVLLYYELAEPLTYVLDTPIPVTYFVNDLGTEGITPTGVDANGVPNTAPLRASLQYGLTEGEMYGNLQAQSLPLAAFQAFLTALGTQMNGTWAMTENDGQYSFTFTPD